ncbi:hypothetical protein QTP70_034763 [Hemibagrus guttatus]|uniref:RING-type domain-containing protein n=1 Tax=Hemibagrus guttatus TaxID=175788 RepID=A0AAE0UR86_9TELE|nr:hypothetical protein QTP70_034763 [Hemibagrus guttatus]
MLEHGVRYGQAVTSTEVQQQDTTRVQIRGAVPPNHDPPGITVVAHMGVEVPQQNYGVPSRSTFQHPSQGLQEGWVLHTAVRPISRNNSETPIPGPKEQGNNPLVYWGKLQHVAAELGGYKQAHPSLTPLTMGHSREEEGPTSLKELGSRAQAILLREGCKKILVADSLSLLQKMHRTQMRGVRVDEENICEACHVSILPSDTAQPFSVVVFHCRHMFHKECLPSPGTIPGGQYCNICSAKRRGPGSGILEMKK